jgi:predicted negative regulator of RcsB-dependent stress response
MAGTSRNVFHVKLEDQAAVGTPGVLDQLQLPPALITFLQKNQRVIWRVIIAVAVTATAAALYSSWRSHVMTKAAEAYDQAAELKTTQEKKAAFQKIAAEYGSTSAALWSRIALAHLEQEEENFQGALELLAAAEQEAAAKSPLKPLLLVNLGNLYEQLKQFAKAESVYQQLQTFKGFEPLALASLGRVYEAKGKNGKAVQVYQQYMGLAEMGKDQSNDALPQSFSEQEIVQASLNRLLQ